jgi:hypothetical protein
MLTIREATQTDRADLSWRLCQEDAAELEAAGVGMDCIDGVPAKALTWGEQLVCLFGVTPNADGPAVPWMLCTSTIAEVPRRSMAEVSAGVVQAWKREHDALANLVHRENARALRFLRWLGFTIDTRPIGPGGAFYLFFWEAPDV